MHLKICSSTIQLNPPIKPDNSFSFFRAYFNGILRCLHAFIKFTSESTVFDCSFMLDIKRLRSGGVRFEDKGYACWSIPIILTLSSCPELYSFTQFTKLSNSGSSKRNLL